MHSGHFNFNSIIKIHTAIQQHNNAYNIRLDTPPPPHPPPHPRPPSRYAHALGAQFKSTPKLNLKSGPMLHIRK